MTPFFNLTYTKSIISILAIGLLTFIFNLHNPVVREWDEATYGINAFEMSNSSQPLVVTFLGQSDVYNSKPPFGVWLMAISTKIFGFNTFSLRFASAFLSLLLTLYIFHFIYKQFNNIHWALISSITLMSSIGFTGWHEARSGDFDAIVAAFICAFVLSSFQLLNNNLSKGWLFPFLFLTLACLTKGVYGLVAIPGVIAFFIYKNRLKFIMSHWQLYLGTSVFLATFMGYYFIREYLTPGYLNAVLQNEVGERIFLEKNIHKTEIPFYYHTLKLLFYRFQPFILLLPFVAYKFWFEPNNKKRELLAILILAALSVWTIISFSKTKLVWYDGSLYPLLAILIGYYLSHQTRLKLKSIYVILGAIWLSVFGLNQCEKDSFKFPDFLNKLRNENMVTEDLYIYSSNFEHPIRYYLLKDSLEGNKSIYLNNLNQIPNDGLLILNSKQHLKNIQEPFVKIDSLENLILIRLKSK
jgi:4-amino-4-deoxy-L-arabinose transferase-like glycosyltransferase